MKAGYESSVDAIEAGVSKVTEKTSKAFGNGLDATAQKLKDTKAAFGAFFKSEGYANAGNENALDNNANQVAELRSASGPRL